MQGPHTRDRCVSQRSERGSTGGSAMPRPTARFPRLTTSLSILGAGLPLAACSGGGGGDGGTGAPAAASPAADSTSVTLGWDKAQGPVAGYSLYVQRGEADFVHEADVTQTRATVSGTPGSTARVIVVAF